VSRFKATCIWPYNPKAMDNTIQPSNIYTIAPNSGGTNDWMLDEKLNQEQQHEDKKNVKKNVLHIHTS
jgi:hypothetical protein